MQPCSDRVNWINNTVSDVSRCKYYINLGNMVETPISQRSISQQTVWVKAKHSIVCERLRTYVHNSLEEQMGFEVVTKALACAVIVGNKRKHISNYKWWNKTFEASDFDEKCVMQYTHFIYLRFIYGTNSYIHLYVSQMLLKLTLRQCIKVTACFNTDI